MRRFTLFSFFFKARTCRTMELVDLSHVCCCQTVKMKKTQNLVFKKVMHTAFSIGLPLVVVINASFWVQSVFAQESTQTANAMLEKHAELKSSLAQNQYRRPLFLESAETADTVSSTAYAVLDSPFSAVSETFKKPDHWCDVLILHINTKYCQATTNTSPSTLAVNIGKKTPQTLSESFLLEFSYRVISSSPDYLAVRLHADKGPLSTTDYQMVLQAVPLPEGKTFINLRYSYGYGLAGRLAMQAYLATIGRDKVGFSKLSQEPSSSFVGGMRGTVERNTMRYFLAIEAYLASLKQPSAQQFNSRIQYWFDATEQYSRQLHEVDRSDYIQMKKDEYLRQRAKPVAAE